MSNKKTWIVLVKHQCSQAVILGDTPQAITLEVDAECKKRAESYAVGAVSDTFYATDVDAMVDVVSITLKEEYVAIHPEWPSVRRLK